MDKAPLLTLSAPKKPAAGGVAPTAVTIGQLDADGMELYRMLFQEYACELQEFRKREEALAMFYSHLMMTIAESLLIYIYNCKTPYDFLKTLKDTFAPTAVAREKDVLARWKLLQKAPRRGKVGAWLHKWELTYHDANALNIPDVSGTQAQEAFVTATADVNPSFYNFFKIQVKLNKAYPPFNNLINTFHGIQ